MMAVRALLAWLVLWAAVPCAAQELHQTLTRPTWVLSGAAIDCDFSGKRGYNCAIDQNFTTTRASVGYAQAISGIWYQFANNIPRITDNGWLIEIAATNSALWARDMTNAAWTAVNITPALNATGIDGTANSATTLTATAGLGSIAQTFVLGSAAENYSVWLKGVTVTGAINISINNFVGTTACTVNTTTFTRCTATATLANPVIGIQIVNNGDVVIADFNQLEAGTFPTSPIGTTTAAATRAADVVATIGLVKSTLAGNEFSFAYSVGAFSSVQGRVITHTAQETITINTSTVMRLSSGANNADATFGSGTVTSAPFKGAVALGAAGMSNVAANGTVGINAAAWVPIAASQFGGSIATANRQPSTYFLRATFWNNKLPDATLKALTQ